jgi:hypothetical protein
MNDFSKEERVAFDDILEGFNDALVISAKVSKYDIGDVEAERASDTIWRPQPYIFETKTGMDQTGNFVGNTQLSVPSSLAEVESAPFLLNAKELRDAVQEDRLVRAAKQKLASDINTRLLNTASMQGAVVVARSVAATGYDDVAEIDSVFNERGVPMGDRHLCLNSRDYNKMASNLAERQTMNEMPTEAYRKSYVGDVAGFDTCKMDVSQNLTAAAGVGVTFNGANQRHVPKATETLAGAKRNVDNRYQDITVAVTSGTVKAGDCFQIAGVNSVHMITKEDTGQPMTFRVIAVNSATSLKISPAIVDGTHGGAVKSEKQYQNVSATPADGAAITFLNTVTTKTNPFWHKDAIELLPGRLIMPKKSGLRVMSATTDQGIHVLMTAQGDINDLSVKYRLDTYYGTVCTDPMMAGIELFGQT